MGTGIDKASILADRYRDDRGQLAAALMGQPVPDQQLDAYSALRAMQILKETDRMAMAQQARGPSGEQPSLAELAVTPEQPMGLAGMMGQPVMAQAQPAMPGPEMQAASGGLAGMPMADDDYAEGGIVAFASGGRPSSADYMKQAMENIPKPTSLAEREAGMTGQQEYVNKLFGPDRMVPYLEEIAKEKQGIEGNKDRNLGYAMLAASQAIVSDPNLARAAGKAAGAFGNELQKLEKEDREAKRALRQSEMTLAAAQQARDDGKTKQAISLFDKYNDQNREAQKMLSEVNAKNAQIEAGVENAKLQAQVAREGHAVQREGFNKPDQIERELAIIENNLGRKFTTEERMAARAKLYEDQYGARYTGLGGDKSGKITGDFQKDLRERTGILNLQKQMRNVSEAEVEDINRRIEQERLRLIEEYRASGQALTGKAPAGGAPTAQQAAPISVTSKEQFAKLPSGTTFVAPDGSVRIKP
jgi:hypothetical protein